GPEGSTARERRRFRKPRPEVRAQRRFDPQRGSPSDADIAAPREAASHHDGRLHPCGGPRGEEVALDARGPPAGPPSPRAHRWVRLRRCPSIEGRTTSVVRTSTYRY